MSSQHVAFRGCADDIGGAIASYKLLKIVKHTFDKAAKFAGLQLNPKKCVIILARFSNFDDQVSEIKEWLASHLDEWKDFKIESSHPYLGSPIGPGAGDSMWDKPISKYWGRGLRIAACGLSAYYSILAYNTYVVSCLECWCQL